MHEDHKKGIREQAERINADVKKNAGAMAKKQEELETLQAAVDVLESEQNSAKEMVNQLLGLIGDAPCYEIKKKKTGTRSSGAAMHRIVTKKCDYCGETYECGARQTTCLKCQEAKALHRVDDDPDDPDPPAPPQKPTSKKKPAPKPKSPEWNPGRQVKQGTEDNDSLLSDFTTPGKGKVKKGCRKCGKAAYVMPVITACPHCPDGTLAVAYD